MRVAVYNTYVTKKSSGIMHFDIIVADETPGDKVLDLERNISRAPGKKDNLWAPRNVSSATSSTLDRQSNSPSTTTDSTSSKWKDVDDTSPSRSRFLRTKPCNITNI